MSMSTTSTINLRRERLEATLRALLPDATSRQLSGLAIPQRQAQRTTASVLSSLEKRTATVTATEGVTASLRAVSPDALPACAAFMQQSRTALERGLADDALKLALKGEGVLQCGLADAAAQAGRQERVVIGSVVAEALTRIGCSTSVYEGDERTGVWAERGHQMVGGRLDSNGEFLLDIAGCDGGECMPLHHELELKLEKLGVDMDDVVDVDHEDERGGTLIHTAAMMRDQASMAERLAKAELSRFSKAAEQLPTRLGTV